MRTSLVAALAAVIACGNHAGSPPKPHDDARPHADATVLEQPARALGEPDLAGYGWRKRGGQAAFHLARKAEGREDWPAVVIACHDALATDPGHLEAAWLYAVALAKTGKLDAVTEPLALAAAGDFGKWATASLEQPALQPYLSTPAGDAWKRRVQADAVTYAAALARSIVVLADGDLYAVDPVAPRWYRLTRSYGAVVAAFPAPDDRRLAYLTRTRAHGAKASTLAIGSVDLATGHGVRPVRVGIAEPFFVGYSTVKPNGFWIGSPNGWYAYDDDKLHAVPGKPAGPGNPKLELTVGGGVHVRRVPVAQVSADFDDQALASAIKLGTSNRVVTVPSPGQIDGNTIVWSADRAHLAFVAALSDRCVANTPNAAAFVADAATGTVQELERASGGIALEWLADRKLAIAGDSGVSIVELGGNVQKLDGADGLVTPRRKAKCTPSPAAEPIDIPDDDVADPGDSGSGSPK